jgi:hypothetical protein
MRTSLLELIDRTARACSAPPTVVLSGADWDLYWDEVEATIRLLAEWKLARDDSPLGVAACALNLARCRAALRVDLGRVVIAREAP